MNFNKNNPIKKFILFLIKSYQKTFSPDHGFGRYFFSRAGCRFYPSCSEYMYQSLERYGLGRGIWFGLRRLAHCHPWSRGGYDPIKE